MAEKDRKAAAPVLEELFPTPEIFASEVASVLLVHGNVIITFANPRMNEPSGGALAKAQRVVAGRLILTGVAASQLVNNIQGLAEKVKAATTPKPKT